MVRELNEINQTTAWAVGLAYHQERFILSKTMLQTQTQLKYSIIKKISGSLT